MTQNNSSMVNKAKESQVKNDVQNNSKPTKLTQEQVNKKAFMDLVDKYKDQISVALPKHLTAERMIRLVLTAMSRNPKLLTCDPKTIFGAVIQGSQLGLEFGVGGQAHLVPFYNGKTKQFEAQFMAGYQGLITLAQRSGQIKTIHADIVKENDFFDFAFGSGGFIKHKPKLSDRGETIAYYAYAQTNDGGEYYEVMSVDDMEKHRDKYSKSKNRDGEIYGSWVDEFDKMGEKTVLIQVCKLLPKSIEMKTAIQLENLADSGLSQGLTLDKIDIATGTMVMNDEYSGDAEETEIIQDGGIMQQHIEKINSFKSPQEVLQYQNVNLRDALVMADDESSKILQDTINKKLKEFE